MVDTNFYKVQRGDTLDSIAKQNNTTVTRLAKINSIKDVNRIDVGQVLAMKSESALKVDVQLLDRDRNPIRDAKVRIEHNGRVLDRISGKDGRVLGVTTERPDDPVSIWIQRPDKSWKKVVQITSEWGNKLITLVSPKIKLETKTQPHPKDESGRPLPEAKKESKLKGASIPAPTPGNSMAADTRVPMVFPRTSMGKGEPQSLFSTATGQFGIKSTSVTYSNGAPALLITSDQSELDFLDEFNDEFLTDADFKWAAKELDVEEAVIRAINDVEAAGKGFETIYERKVPKILYERQWFHRLTNGIYTADNKDISCPTGYYQKTARFIPATQVITDAAGKQRSVSYWRRYSKKKDASRFKESKTGKQLFDEGLATKVSDQYLAAEGSYKRLLKAYRLNKEAALKSCSWGAFQIMGFHYVTMGYSTVAEFVRCMSRSEREQVIALVKFFKKVNPELISAMKAKNFERLAAGFNGAGYKENKYDDKLQESYNKWKNK